MTIFLWKWINTVVFGKVALKRQQAAEDAIALKMAKVATGQKLDRLPQGKIFGMSVTEPKSTVDQNEDATPAAKKIDGTSENSKELPHMSINDAARVQNCSVRMKRHRKKKNEIKCDK